MLSDSPLPRKRTEFGIWSRVFSPVPLRLTVQACFALFHVFLVWQLARHIAWVLGRTEQHVAAPAAVDGWLPIVSLMSLKRWLLTGQWDGVHPASLTIFLALLAMCAIFRRGFCGWICPLGGLSNGLDRVGRRLGLSWRVSGRWRYVLWVPKYLLLVGVLTAFVLLLSLPAIEQFRSMPYYVAAQARMFQFFAQPSGLVLLVLALLVGLSLVVRNFWCRFLCPYGALLGLAGLLSPVAVQRNPDACVQCERCSRACPNGISVHRAGRVNTPECVGCGECVGACPVPDCLSMRAGSRRVRFWVVGAGAVGVLFLFYFWGRATGHWDADLPQEMVRRLTRMSLDAGMGQ